MSKSDKMYNNSTITIEENLAHDQHSHSHNYNELDPTLACVGKNCPHHSNQVQKLPPNGKEIVRDNPSKGILILEKSSNE